MKMMTWPVIHYIYTSDAQKNSAQFKEDCEKAYNAMKPRRAEAIEAAISVEGLLDAVLLDLFIGPHPSRRENSLRRWS